MRTRHLVFSLSVLLLGLAACSTNREARSLVRPQAAKPGTEVQIQQNGRECIADIRCPSGIGWAKFSLAAGARPGNVTFRLHLRGLEGATFEHDGAVTQISVSSHGDLAIRESRRNGDPISPRDHVPVTFVPASGGEPRIPLDGWFEIRPPRSCTGDCEVRLSWIDFYR